MPANNPRQTLRRLTYVLLMVLSLTALLEVLVGFTQPPSADEGTGAHVFQLAIAALVPTGLLFVATADWARPARTLWRLAVPVGFVVLAFGTLYYLEHYFYAGRYPAP